MKLLVLTMFGQLLQQNILVNRDFIAGGPCHVLTMALAICKSHSVTKQTTSYFITLLNAWLCRTASISSPLSAAVTVKQQREKRNISDSSRVQGMKNVRRSIIATAGIWETRMTSEECSRLYNNALSVCCTSCGQSWATKSTANAHTNSSCGFHRYEQRPHWSIRSNRILGNLC